MATLSFKCPKCDALLTVPETMAGKDGACPKCQSVICIPFPILMDQDGGDSERESGASERFRRLETTLPAESNWFVKKVDDSEIGPFTSEELVDRMVRGEYPPSARARRSSSDDWHQIMDYPELFKLQMNRSPRLKENAVVNRATRFTPVKPDIGAEWLNGGIAFVIGLLIVVLSCFFAFMIFPNDPIRQFLACYFGIQITSVIVLIDAARIRLEDYRTQMGGPIRVFIGCLLLWIVVFPWYLATRGAIARGELER